MQVALALFPGFTALDAIGPYAVLASLPGAELVTVAAERGLVKDDAVLTINADASFDEIDAPDVIVVPGGLITRRMARDRDAVIDWIAAVHPTTTWTTSVCTGAILLGAAGVLDGLEATTHWIAYDQLAAFGASPTSRRVVRQGRVITAAGVSSGIDMAITLVAEMAGPEVAQAIQLGIEYDPQPPYDAGAPDKAPPAITGLVSQMLRDNEAAILTR
jgi:transcriptional regulator GlxA family with amidase domain